MSRFDITTRRPPLPSRITSRRPRPNCSPGGDAATGEDGSRSIQKRSTPGTTSSAIRSAPFETVMRGETPGAAEPTMPVAARTNMVWLPAVTTTPLPPSLSPVQMRMPDGMGSGWTCAPL